MIEIPKLRFHKQLIQITKVNLLFRKTVNIVINPTLLFQPVYENNEKIKKENGENFIFDQNHLQSPSMKTFKHTRIRVNQMNIFHFTL